VTCNSADAAENAWAAARLKAEKNALSECFEAAPGFVASMEGPGHRIVFANAACRQMLGDRDVRGKAVAEAVPQGLVSIIDQVYRTGELFTARALPVRLPDHHGITTDKFIDVVYAPKRDRAGNIVGVISEGHDVTELVETCERARSLQDELIHLSRVTTMGTMASAIAHELNQPLSAIVTMAAATKKLLDQGRTEEASEALSAISRGALTAGRILKNIHSMSMKREPDPASIDLEPLVAVTIDLFSASDQTRIGVEVEPGLTVVADKIQLQQVLLNLLRNALEAIADRPGGKVRVQATAGDEHVLITVADDGPGIVAESLNSIFQSFVTTKAEGMGIGLAISRTIIEAHGGQLWAENAPNGGAVLAMTLPTEPAIGALRQR